MCERASTTGTGGMTQPRDGRQAEKLEKGCEGGRGGGPERQERCRTRWRLEAEGREDGVPGAAGQWAELPGRKEQQAACGLGEAARPSCPPESQVLGQGASGHRHLSAPI